MTLVVEAEINEIGPRISSGYEPGQEAQLHVAFYVHATRSWYDITAFDLYYDIFLSDGTPVVVNGWDGYYNLEWIWVTEKEWSKTRNISFGTMPNEPLEGYYTLRDYNLDELVTRSFYIPVRQPNGNGNGNGAKVPWGWIALGAGAIASAIIIAKKRR